MNDKATEAAAFNASLGENKGQKRPVVRVVSRPSKTTKSFSGSASVKLEPLPEEEAAFKGHCAMQNHETAKGQNSDSDSGIVTMMDEENDENANKAKKAMMLQQPSWPSRSG